MQTAQERRLRLPAEWEPHEAVWLGWPHNASDWSPRFGAIPWVFAEMVRLLAPSERVMLLVNDAAHEKRARSVLRRAFPGWDAPQDLGHKGVGFVTMPTNRGWTRDFMPFFLRSSGKGAVLDCGFNGWARYADHELDNAAGSQLAGMLAKETGAELLQAQQHSRHVVLEGGALDGNGAGLLLASEECLLDATTQVRNPGWGRVEYERFFASHLGVEQTIWLGRGIAGDDTHGHVDDFCRFVAKDTVLLCDEKNPADPNHQALEENRERLEQIRLPDGGRLEVVRLPMPPQVVFAGERLPASYANFYIGNNLVLAPTFNAPQDRQALGLLAELFPGRQVVGVHAGDLIQGLGAVHCLTHEQPRLDSQGESLVRFGTA